MKIGIMQPYLIPYIGYFQLVHKVDVFILTDNYKYSKGGWISRNRILQNGVVKYLSIPLVGESDYLNISERRISDVFSPPKILNVFRESYRDTEFYDEIFPIAEAIFNYPERNLLRFISNSLVTLLRNLEINTEIMYTSQFALNPDSSGKDKIFQICKDLRADTYINLPGGRSLYNCDEFLVNGIELKFLEPNITQYQQKSKAFIPNLSVMDVLFSVGIRSLICDHVTNFSID